MAITKTKLFIIIFLLCFLLYCKENRFGVKISDEMCAKWKIDSNGCLGYRNKIAYDSLIVLKQFIGLPFKEFEYYFGKSNMSKNNYYLYFISCSQIVLKKELYPEKELNIEAGQFLIKTDSANHIIKMHSIYP